MASPFGFPYQQFVAKEYRIMWSLFPPNLLSEALKLLLDATSKPENVGIRWSTWSDCSPNNNNCIMSIVSTHFNIHITIGFLLFSFSSFHCLHFVLFV